MREPLQAWIRRSRCPNIVKFKENKKDESVEIAPLCNPIIKNSGMPFTSSEQSQGICVGKEGTLTVGLCSFVETSLGCVSVKLDIP